MVKVIPVILFLEANKSPPETLITFCQADVELLVYSCCQNVINLSLVVQFRSCFVLSSSLYSSEEEFNKTLNY